MRNRWLQNRLAFVVVLSMAQFAIGADQPPAGTAEPKAANTIESGQRVLTCGHSFHAWFVAPILKEMAQGAGIEGHQIVAESKIGGSRAIQHWEVSDDKNRAKTALREGKVDVLTLACMLEPDDGIEKFAKLGLEHNPQFRVSLQESWMPFDKSEWPFRGNQDSVDFNAATSQTLRELHRSHFKSMDDYVRNLNTTLGKQVVFVAPAGQAVVALREKVMAGQVPGIKQQADLFTDKLGHPQHTVEALVSYVHFAVIYRRSPVGLPIPAVLKRGSHPQWDDKLNRTLQEIAWQVVTDHPLSGLSENAAE